MNCKFKGCKEDPQKVVAVKERSPSGCREMIKYIEVCLEHYDTTNTGFPNDTPTETSVYKVNA